MVCRRKPQATKIADGDGATSRRHLPWWKAPHHMAQRQKAGRIAGFGRAAGFAASCDMKTEMAVTPRLEQDRRSALLASAFPRLDQTFPTSRRRRSRACAGSAKCAHYAKRRNAVRNRQAPAPACSCCCPAKSPSTQRDGLGHVSAHHRPGTGTVSRRDRPAFGPRRAVSTPRRRRRRDAPDFRRSDCGRYWSPKPISASAHAGADPAPGQPDPGRGRGPVLIGPSNSSGGVRLQSFLTRNGIRIICSTRTATTTPPN